MSINPILFSTNTIALFISICLEFIFILSPEISLNILNIWNCE